MHDLLLAYYADDFTGATDALERLSLAGVRSALFLSPPTAAQLEQFADLQAVGVAGRTRSMTPDAIVAEIRPALRALKSLGARHVHYKVCSTFDSSPAIGSIGRVIDVALEEFDAPFVPLLVAAPPLGRYCAFGNLFAREAVGKRGWIYRLDRHPSMSAHPITPADESDLRLHLARQTANEIQLFDILSLELPDDQARSVLREMLCARTSIVLFDVLYDEQLRKIGRLIDDHASGTAPLFSVGSSGIEMALTAHWASAQRLPAKPQWKAPGPAGPLLVVSGSCSRVTAAQISWAVANGFFEVPLDTTAIVDQRRADQEIAQATADIVARLGEGMPVLVHTGKGADDPRVAATRAFFAKRGWDESAIKTQSARLLGTALGKIVRGCLEQTSLGRCCVAGGDTSSYAAAALDIQSLQMLAPLAPGAPLCRVHAPGAPAHDLEINFKGGQVGEAAYFGQVARGEAAID
jgi:uncharacterized protein YgbK (DUF1537 family)